MIIALATLPVNIFISTFKKENTKDKTGSHTALVHILIQLEGKKDNNIIAADIHLSYICSSFKERQH